MTPGRSPILPLPDPASLHQPGCQLRLTDTLRALSRGGSAHIPKGMNAPGPPPFRPSSHAPGVEVQVELPDDRS